MGSGAVCFSEPPSMLIATTVQCSDVFLMRCLAIKKKLWESTVNLTACTSDQLLTQRKLVWSQDLDNTACVPVLLAIIHCDNQTTCNEQLWPCVGAEARPVLIWDKDRLLINGPKPLALCLGFSYATNTMGRMLRLRRERQRAVDKWDRSAGQQKR